MNRSLPLPPIVPRKKPAKARKASASATAGAALAQSLSRNYQASEAIAHCCRMIDSDIAETDQVAYREALAILRAPARNHMTALEAFEAEHKAIAALLARISVEILDYDRDISSVPGGHQSYAHAGTLEYVRTQLELQVSHLRSARANTVKREG